MHGSLDAIAKAAAGRRFSADEIEEVVVTVAAAIVQSVLEPVAHKLAPRTPYEAKFSLQYSAAAMLIDGQVGIATYTDEAIADPRVLDLSQKVRYETREYPSSLGAFPGGVRAMLADGRVFETDCIRKAAPTNHCRPIRYAPSSAQTPRSRSTTKRSKRSRMPS